MARSEESKGEERKESSPIQAFQEELAKSARGKEYQQVMTMEQYDAQLQLMKTNNQHVILLDFLSPLSGNGAFTQAH